MADITENVEPDITFTEGSDVGKEPEPLFPGSTPEEYSVTQRELLMCIDICDLAYTRSAGGDPRQTMHEINEKGKRLGLTDLQIIEFNGSESVVGKLPDGRSFIAFRGTETTVISDPYAMFRDVITDFSGKIVNLNVGLGVSAEAPPEFQGIIYAGFARYVHNIYDRLTEWLTQQGDQPFVVYGHSLGAAAALVFTYMYYYHTGRKPQRTYAVGSPKGIELFGTLWDDEFDTLTVLTRSDLISFVHPIFHSHKGHKVMLGDGGFELMTPNNQPERIPQGTEEQYAYMRKKQQSNTLNTVEEIAEHQSFDVSAFDKSFFGGMVGSAETFRSVGSALIYPLPQASLKAVKTYGSVSGHLLSTYRSLIEEQVPSGITTVPIEPRDPKPWYALMEKGMPGYHSFEEVEKRSRFKYIRKKLEKPVFGPQGPPPGFEPRGPMPEREPASEPTANQTPSSLSSAPVSSVSNAILDSIHSDMQISGYMFYPAEKENEYAYNFIGY